MEMGGLEAEVVEEIVGQAEAKAEEAEVAAAEERRRQREQERLAREAEGARTEEAAAANNGADGAVSDGAIPDGAIPDGAIPDGAQADVTTDGGDLAATDETHNETADGEIHESGDDTPAGDHQTEDQAEASAEGAPEDGPIISGDLPAELSTGEIPAENAEPDQNKTE